MVNIRKNTKAQWLTENPTLRAGEQGLERDTKKVKEGDGSTPWKELPYVFNKALADSKYAPISLVDAATGPVLVEDPEDPGTFIIKTI